MNTATGPVDLKPALKKGIPSTKNVQQAENIGLPIKATRNVSVIGLGYVGLPLAVQAAEKGYKISGLDLSDRLISLVNDRISPFINDVRFESAFEKVSTESLSASKDFTNLKKTEVVVICVPTPTTNNIPDLGYVLSATEQVARHLQKGQLVILESTVNPGVTRDNILPVLEGVSGLKVGTDFFLAHCPERIDPGNKTFHVGNLNRVVGGITAECTSKAVEFYTSIIDAKIIPLDSTEEAEFVKSWENTHRNVMIALGNEAAKICDGLGMDISNVLKGLQSKVDQFGLRLAQPGIGPGGHCIPEDIHYVIRRARQNGLDTRFLDSAADLNDSMQDYAVQRFSELLDMGGSKLATTSVGLLGLAYKENIEDSRRSPALKIAESLMNKAEELFIHDPHVDRATTDNMRNVTRVDQLEDLLSNCEAIFLATGHREYVELITPELLNKHGIRFIFDGRNCLDKAAFRAAGIIYRGIGR